MQILFRSMMEQDLSLKPWEPLFFNAVWFWAVLIKFVWTFWQTQTHISFPVLMYVAVLWPGKLLCGLSGAVMPCALYVQMWFGKFTELWWKLNKVARPRLTRMMCVGNPENQTLDYVTMLHNFIEKNTFIPRDSLLSSQTVHKSDYITYRFIKLIITITITETIKCSINIQLLFKVSHGCGKTSQLHNGQMSNIQSCFTALLLELSFLNI